MTVGVTAGGNHFYYPPSSGNIDNCPVTSWPDHVVQLVGYTSSRWIIKNSWGTNWGVNGYAFIPFNNDCGILNHFWIIQTNPAPGPNPDPEP